MDTTDSDTCASAACSGAGPKCWDASHAFHVTGPGLAGDALISRKLLAMQEKVNLLHMQQACYV